MTNTIERKYPIGIQTFSEIIRNGYLYIDKTDLVWQMAHYAKFIFLSRPRRFGKSLLTSTLQSYFEGKKDLFEGLKIMDWEQEWEQYPVLRLDISASKGQTSADALRARLMLMLDTFADIYGKKDTEVTPGGLLEGLIRRAYAQTGKQVVVVIDEYDAPLLDVLHESEELKEMRKVMQEFYIPLKVNEQYVKFCFIAGITKFSQLSIFSTINNLTNVTMDSMFASICGITEHELTTALKPDIERLAGILGLTCEEMHQKLKLKYDGYHFVEDSEEIYNPYSLLKAFQQRKVANYWFESGTPTFLIQQMQHFHTDITQTDDIISFASDFDRPTEAMTSVLPLLYQSGYLTIKDYDRESESYTLAIPNQEVRIGFTEGLLPTYLGLESSQVRAGFALKFWRALKKNDIDLALIEMQAYFAGLPYIEGFKQKMGDITKTEGFYEWTFYLVFSMLNVYVKTQVKTIKGRTDMVVWMPDAIYVFELKINGTAQEALDQIDQKGYAIPYQTDGRRVVKVGIRFSTETLAIEKWTKG